MSIITIVLFFLYTWGLGFTATKFLKNSDNFLERNLMRIGIGLGIFVVLTTIMNLFHIPLDWKIYLVVSLIIPFYSLIISIRNKQTKLPQLKLTKSTIIILVVLFLFLATFFMYHKGAFAYPYLENDDPWDHAKGIKFVSIEKTAETPDYFADRFFYYLDPYPPGYEVLMGVLHQTSPSLNWTMKFFNALIISLGIIFFYFFARIFIGSRKKALFATFVFAAIPCYLSHFIWAHSLVITLFFPAMYCLERIKYDKRWMIPGILVIGGICLTHMLQPIKLGILFALYFITKSILQKKFMKTEFFTIVGGYLLSFLWWGFKWKGMWSLALGGGKTTDLNQIGGISVIVKIITSITKIFSAEGGTATRAYTFNDFFIAKSQNMINNPIGIGIFISILTIVALVYIIFRFKSMPKEKNHWLVITVVWFIFLFLFVNSETFNLPIGFGAFRMWMLLTIPVALLAAEGAWFLLALGKKFKVPAIIILTILIAGVFFTSAQQKYDVNTAMWPPGKSWTSYEELNSWSWMLDNLPVNTKVYSYSDSKRVFGFDQFACVWCEDFIEFNEGILDKNMTEVHQWLKINQYEYLIFSAKDFKNYGKKIGEENATTLINQRMNEAGSMPDKFQVAQQSQGFILFKII
ncbi:MAG: hypothetical protein KJ597_00280 [Nanoarchaeota archaeon]|nr:hypothetical protein [Nanoarchaeota archaeon]MBU1621990.1 hypothetical protein [Nanoarchaeota archaeon]